MADTRMPPADGDASFVVFNATKVDGAGIDTDFWVHVSDGIIAKTGTGDTWRSLRVTQSIDAAGDYLAESSRPKSGSGRRFRPDSRVGSTHPVRGA